MNRFLLYMNAVAVLVWQWQHLGEGAVPLACVAVMILLVDARGRTGRGGRP